MAEEKIERHRHHEFQFKWESKTPKIRVDDFERRRLRAVKTHLSLFGLELILSLKIDFLILIIV